MHKNASCFKNQIEIAGGGDGAYCYKYNNNKWLSDCCNAKACASVTKIFNRSQNTNK